MFKLGLKDRKILYELDANCRQSASEIGRKVGLSAEVVNYRIKRLEREGIITHYQLIANLSALGIYQFKLCLQLEHMTSGELDALLADVAKREEVKWIVQTKGSWDLLLAVETTDINRINPLKNELLALFGRFVGEKAFSLLVEADTYSRNYLLEKAAKKARLIMKRSDLVAIDGTDRLILRSLAKNARKPLLEIAGEVGESSRMVYYRMRQLEKKRIILGYKIAIDYGLLGIKFYKTFISLDAPRPDRVRSLKATLEQHPNVTHIVDVLSGWDLEPEFETESEASFNEILRAVKDDFADIIKRIDIVTITKEHKFTYF